MTRFYFLMGLLLSLHFAAANKLWEFGTDVAESTEVFSNSGYFQLWDKFKEIQIEVPHCMNLIYVRVTVGNLISTPSTTFDKETRIVTISYGMLQNSISSYEIIGKAVPLIYCS